MTLDIIVLYYITEQRWIPECSMLFTAWNHREMGQFKWQCCKNYSLHLHCNKEKNCGKACWIHLEWGTGGIAPGWMWGNKSEGRGKKNKTKYAVDENGAVRVRGSLAVDTHEQNFMLSCSKCHVFRAVYFSKYLGKRCTIVRKKITLSHTEHPHLWENQTH